MKIKSLSVQRFMRITSAEISPDGSLVVLRGKNAQGKTSILDAISALLEGKKACPDKPIHEGAEDAVLLGEIGDYTVTRTFKGDETMLTVKTKEGAKISNGQSVLDGFLGTLSFDPMQFARMDATGQSQMLAKATGVSLAEFNIERKTVFEKRTEVNRDVKSKEGQLKGLQDEVGQYLADAEYTKEKSVDEIKDRLDEARDAHMAYQSRVRLAQDLEKKAQTLVDERTRLQTRLAEIKSELETADSNMLKQVAENVEEEKTLPDMDAITAEFQTIGQHNTIVAKVRSYHKISGECDLEKQKSKELSLKLDDIDQRKAEAVAKAKIPVEGLSFDENGVTLNGIPFSQASSAEKWKTSIAIAMALNPKLRVIRITDGSLLDADSMKALEEMADFNDFQIWIETVGNEDNGVDIYVEDGVAKQPKKAKKVSKE